MTKFAGFHPKYPSATCYNLHLQLQQRHLQIALDQMELVWKKTSLAIGNLMYWLMKSEPKVYSIADLERDRYTIWDGVRNYQARNFLRQMQLGDLAFFYHSNTTLPSIVGLMRVVVPEIVDPTQFEPNSKYYDPKSNSQSPRWHTVKVEFVATFPSSISLETLKQEFSTEELLVVRPGNRLSVMSVAEEVAQKILAMAK